MSAATSKLVFKRTWSYRWIGAPLCLFTAVWVMNKVAQDHFKDWRFGGIVIVGCLAVVLGLWLPSRMAVWPLRVLGGLISVAMFLIFNDAWQGRSQTHSFGGWRGIFDIIHFTKGIVLFGFLGMWFALTGKIGWREDQRPIIL